MSDILFNPQNTSPILPKDVLNIIGTYVKHPLADLIKNDTRVRIAIPAFASWGDFHKSKYKDMFEAHISVSELPTYAIDPRFEISLMQNKHVNLNYYFLKNIIPMHRDTFFMMYMSIIHKK